MTFRTKEPKTQDYQRFIREGLSNNWDDNQSNVKHEFSKMSKLFGLSYIYWLEIQYKIFQNDGGFTFEELCKWNGNVPSGFFKKFD